MEISIFFKLEIRLFDAHAVSGSLFGLSLVSQRVRIQLEMLPHFLVCGFMVRSQK